MLLWHSLHYYSVFCGILLLWIPVLKCVVKLTVATVNYNVLYQQRRLCEFVFLFPPALIQTP